MNFHSLHSSSSGNLYRVESKSGEQLLIDPGIPWATLRKSLGYDLSKVIGCLVSHSHLDHCRCVSDIIAHGIPVFSGWETFENTNTDGSVRAIRTEEGTNEQIGPFTVTPFTLRHDVPNLGFIIQDGQDAMLFAIDTPNIEQRFALPFQIIAIECSYDKDILIERVTLGKFNEVAAKRLIHSHMEWRITRQYLTQCCDLSQCEEIYLLHMSGNNIGKEKIRKIIEDEVFEIDVFIGGSNE
jgi:hypothetical protein